MSCGEPDAQQWASPVRRAGRGNGPAVTPAPRPGPTLRLRASEATLCSSLGSEPAELDQPRLLGRELQAERREPAAKLGEEPLRILVVLKAHNVVVGEAHDDHVAVRIPASPLGSPQVEGVVQVHVGEQRRNRCPLRRSLHALRPLPVFDDSCLQPLADQAQQAPVGDPVLEEPQHPPVVDGVIKPPDVRVEHPVHLLSHERGRERVQRPVRAAPRPKPVGEADEVRLIDGVQYLDDRSLQNLVLQRGDPERSLPPVRLRYVHPARRPRPIASAMDPTVQILEVRLQVLPVVLPRHAVYARRGFGLQRPIGRPQTIDRNVMQKRGEPCLLVCLCDVAHAIQRTSHAHSGAVSGACFAGRVPFGQAPFLHHLRDRLRGVVRRFRRYYGPV
jgi:hypothetical protein